ncbi:hypothetical protein D9M72_235970 [compost metagenome]
MAGSANVSAVLSTATSRTGNIKSARASQSRPGLGPGERLPIAAGAAEVRRCVAGVEGDCEFPMNITIPSGRYS